MLNENQEMLQESSVFLSEAITEKSNNAVFTSYLHKIETAKNDKVLDSLNDKAALISKNNERIIDRLTKRLYAIKNSRQVNTSARAKVVNKIAIRKQALSFYSKDVPRAVDKRKKELVKVREKRIKEREKENAKR